jgi:hypothetical protein
MDAIETRKEIVIDGVTLVVEYCEYGDRVTGGIRLPGGGSRGFEVYRDGGGNFYAHDEIDLASPEDRAVADRFFPFKKDTYTPMTFRRPSPALVAAVWAAVDPSRDGVDRAEVESLPLTPTPAPALREITVECLECGATYPIAKAHLVDDGGMGCMRCNH